MYHWWFVGKQSQTAPKEPQQTGEAQTQPAQADPQKRAKNLRKKLKAIEQLQDRVDKGEVALADLDR
eukprot:m.159899 g.159899  ORF g.159899 m.159899 type:complete len:67 (+) comp15160_c0_seq2:73-273(+)